MGIELWFKEDIRNILLATNVSSAATAGNIQDPAVQVYRRGYQAAVMAIGLACGIPPDQLDIWPVSTRHERPLGTDLR
jgi:hypothetical protein